MYQKIAAHPTVREIWGRTLVERGADRRERVEAVGARQYLNELQAAYEKLQPEQDFIEPHARSRRRPARRPRRRPRCRSSGCAS